jgi:hypothetical protein
MVPVRVLVDRMIMDPTECRALLEKAVIIASVTEAEHRQLGGVWGHQDLYRRMLKGQVSRLPKRGMERYRAAGIALAANDRCHAQPNHWKPDVGCARVPL